MGLEYRTLTNLAANAVNDLLSTDADQGESRIRDVLFPSVVQFAIDATATTVELEVSAGERIVVPRSALEGGGTAGVFPNLREKGQQFLVAAGERLRFQVRETGGVATTDINLVLSVEPL